MKLFTKEVERKFQKHPFGSQEDKGFDAEVLVKFFNPYGAGTWLITEAEKQEDGDWMLFDNGNEINMAVGFLCDMDEHITFWCAYSDCGLYTYCDDSPLYWMPLPKPPRGVLDDAKAN